MRLKGLPICNNVSEGRAAVSSASCVKIYFCSLHFPLTQGQPTRNIRRLCETPSKDRAKRTTDPLTIHIQLNRLRPFLFFTVLRVRIWSEIKGESYWHSSQMSSPGERLYNRHVSIQVQLLNTETPSTNFNKYVSLN